MNCRRYPRSALEAWPTRYPHAVSHYRRPVQQRVASVLLACTIGAGLALVLFLSLSS